MRLHPKLLLAAALVAALMVPVQALLAAAGVLVLQVAGGAATDTSLVVTIAGIAVTDFWGGGIVYTLTRANRQSIVVAWAIARIPVLVLVGLVSTNLAILAPITFVLGICAAWGGARVAQTQAQIRDQARVAQSRELMRSRRREARGA